MPTTLSPTDIANLALSKVGAQPIASLLDQTNTSAVICNANFQLAYLEVSRATMWNCLLIPAVLTEIVQTPTGGVTATPASTAWAPNTAYLANVYLTFGGALYITSFAYTSSLSFSNDLTTGALIQTDSDSFTCATFGVGGGTQYPSAWAHEYALPSDFVLLAILNDSNCWNGAGQGSQYEIMGDNLYTNAPQAVIKYVKNTVDTTRFDALFAGAMVANLASKIVTALRLDNGNRSEQLLGEYQRLLSMAMTKDAGESLSRRFSPIQSSMFVRSRYGGVNG